MKSLRRGSIAGNMNLKGKKQLDLCCGCCTVTNFKEKCLAKEHNKEIKEVLTGETKQKELADDHIYWDMTEDGLRNYDWYLQGKSDEKI